jgi:hypothetical protein
MESPVEFDYDGFDCSDCCACDLVMQEKHGETLMIHAQPPIGHRSSAFGDFTVCLAVLLLLCWIGENCQGSERLRMFLTMIGSCAYGTAWRRKAELHLTAAAVAAWPRLQTLSVRLPHPGDGTK